MATPENTITSEDIEKSLSIEFTERMHKSLEPLLKLLDIAEPVVIPDGSNVVIYEIKGTLADDSGREEGDEISRSKYTEKKVDTIEVTVDNYRKTVSAETIRRSGYETAIVQTDRQFVYDIFSKMRTRLTDTIKTGTGTATAGKSIKAAIANAIGKLTTDANEAGYPSGMVTATLVNPQDLYGYLGNSAEFVSTDFGWTYVENYLGLGIVIADANIPQGEVWTTYVNNLTLYACAVDGVNAAGANFSVDPTGIVAVAHKYDYSHASAETYAMAGLRLYPRYQNLVIKAEIDPELDVITVKQAD